jgi:heptosyltransferase-2
MAARTIEPSEIKRILIRSTNWVGDVVMTLPALQAVRDNFRDSAITILARPWVMPLFEHHPAVDSVMAIRKKKGYSETARELLGVAREIRRDGCDMAILFPNSFEAALIAWLSGIGIRIGYRTDGRGFLLTHGINRTPEIRHVHHVEYYLGLLRTMGWKTSSSDPRVFVAPEYLKRAGNLLEQCGINRGDYVVGIGPGAVYGEAKRWPAERFAVIGDWAVRKWNARVLVLGSQGEREICQKVCEAMEKPAVNLCGRTTLGEAMGVIRQCGLFVTNDSGLMHVAAALGAPTVAVFGSTDPTATGPRGPRTRIVVHETPCAPCLRRTCPTDFRCMFSILPEEVWQAMEELRGEE